MADSRPPTADLGGYQQQCPCCTRPVPSKESLLSALDKGLTASTLSHQLRTSHCPHYLAQSMRYASLLRSHEQVLSEVLALDIGNIQSMNKDLLSLTHILLQERQDARQLQCQLSKQASDFEAASLEMQLEIRRLNSDLDVATARIVALQEHSTLQGQALFMLSTGGEVVASRPPLSSPSIHLPSSSNNSLSPSPSMPTPSPGTFTATQRAPSLNALQARHFAMHPLDPSSSTPNPSRSSVVHSSSPIVAPPFSASSPLPPQPPSSSSSSEALSEVRRAVVSSLLSRRQDSAAVEGLAARLLEKLAKTQELLKDEEGQQIEGKEKVSAEREDEGGGKGRGKADD